MQDTETTSWKRLSDTVRNGSDSASTPGARVSPLPVKEAQRLALATEPVRILIVDYDMSSSESVELMLHASGYSQTRIAYSGHAALAIAADFRPSVVLLELDLLDISGYEVARLLREHAQSNDLRLIALTSDREHAGRERARVAGFERYLLKPVTAVSLSRLFQMRVGSARLSSSLRR
jgi:PleD family two-component response regulator